MSVVKSFSVGDGDTFYIKHGSDNFSVIDCCLSDDNKKVIVNEIIEESKNKRIRRFISTHPDEDHIRGLEYLNKHWEILNFYCVKNEANKEEPSESFKAYCKLRDDANKAFYLYKGCSRRWMNMDSKDGYEQHGSAGISILWPETDNKYFKEALSQAKKYGSPNNISPIIVYSCGVTFMWMGDIETKFLNNVKVNINFNEIDVLFAPHHGRKTGNIPEDILKKLNPQIIVIGEAPSEHINYYSKFNTITQNSAGDIIFDINNSSVDVYVSEPDYSVDYLNCRGDYSKYGNYLGSFDKC